VDLPLRAKFSLSLTLGGVAHAWSAIFSCLFSSHAAMMQCCQLTLGTAVRWRRSGMVTKRIILALPMTYAVGPPFSAHTQYYESDLWEKAI